MSNVKKNMDHDLSRFNSDLYGAICRVLETARQNAYKAVNFAMVASVTIAFCAGVNALYLACAAATAVLSVMAMFSEAGSALMASSASLATLRSV